LTLRWNYIGKHRDHREHRDHRGKTRESLFETPVVTRSNQGKPEDLRLIRLFSVVSVLSVVSVFPLES